MEQQMFDRVFICPRCGESGDDFELSSFRPDPSDDLGVFFHIKCGSCNEVVRRTRLSWEFCHRILRRTFQSVDTGSDTYHPCDWRPAPWEWFPGFDQKRSLTVQISDCLDAGPLYPFGSSGMGHKSDALPEFISLMRYLLDTVVSRDTTITTRDFLSWCMARRMIWCFG